MRKIWILLKGFLIGIAAVIPGLSGSVFAVAVGIYQELLQAMSEIRTQFRKSMRLLIPVGIGGAAGVLLSTNLVLWVCRQFRWQSYLFFIGLVLGSFPYIIRKMKKIPIRPLGFLLTVAAFALILLLSYFSGQQEEAENYVMLTQIEGISDVLILFLAGVLSCSLMSVPGVSGSVVLMVIGQYGTVYQAVGKCADLLGALLQGDFIRAGADFSNALLAVPFACGAVVGFLLVAKLLSALLRRAESLCYYAVLGFVSGAAVTLFFSGVLGDPAFFPRWDALALGGGLTAAGIWCTCFFGRKEPEKRSVSSR